MNSSNYDGAKILIGKQETSKGFVYGVLNRCQFQFPKIDKVDPNAFKESKDA
ncbi:hypothetical protein SLEP1_g27558 [Rubroshorea leprosula]|uniref:Uncharacterized protein n=1 Tax=Rubroshorea leprosula TaxID=152421 RepID=A0AAV5K0H2_9ROSI|nr:hypothetical protein SLEP1_g27558 [Rubroshorea leprosula]